MTYFWTLLVSSSQPFADMERGLVSRMCRRYLHSKVHSGSATPAPEEAWLQLMRIPILRGVEAQQPLIVNHVCHEPARVVL